MIRSLSASYDPANVISLSTLLPFGCYVVGGAVLSCLTGEPVNDIDIVVVQSGDAHGLIAYLLSLGCEEAFTAQLARHTRSVYVKDDEEYDVHFCEYNEIAEYSYVVPVTLQSGFLKGGRVYCHHQMVTDVQAKEYHFLRTMRTFALGRAYKIAKNYGLKGYTLGKGVWA